MSLRQLQVTVPKGSGKKVCELFTEHGVKNVTLMKAAPRDPTELVIATLPTGAVEDVIQALKKLLKLKSPDDGVISLLEVRATIPELEPSEVRDQAAREELYNTMVGASRLDKNFILLMAIATVIAAMGLLRDNNAYIIGSMIVAPLLGPAVAMAFATVLGDTRLFYRSTRTELAGLGLAVVCATFIGLFSGVDLSADMPREIAVRMSPSAVDVGLAIGGGIAAALTQLTGLSAALVGVMIAIALLPPAAVVGLGIAHLKPVVVSGAFLLLAINLVCINIAGTVTFALKGVRPANWYWKRKAGQQVRGRLLIWVALLVLLVAAVIAQQLLTGSN